MINIHEILGTENADNILHCDYQYRDTKVILTTEGEGKVHVHQFLAEGMYPCLYTYADIPKPEVGYEMSLIFHFPNTSYRYIFAKLSDKCVTIYQELETEGSKILKEYRYTSKVFEIAPHHIVSELIVQSFIDAMKEKLKNPVYVETKLPENKETNSEEKK